MEGILRSFPIPLRGLVSRPFLGWVIFYTRDLPRIRGKPRPRPRNTFPLAGGLLGRNASIRSVHPVVGLSSNELAYSSLLKFELVSSGPIVTQPGRIVESRPNICNRRRPRQKCSMM
uniref:Uncharacterized protein n=1 Tax=Anopheles maculatus TaxID=74869 RepID=A0A182S6W9_9DIPT